MEPDIQKQIKELDKQYLDNLITKKEYCEALARIAHHYDEWLKRNS